MSKRPPIGSPRRLADGEHPSRVFRAYRNLTLSDLARQTGLSTSYTSEIESNKGGSVTVRQAIDQDMNFAVDDLIEQRSIHTCFASGRRCRQHMLGQESPATFNTALISRFAQLSGSI